MKIDFLEDLVKGFHVCYKYGKINRGDAMGFTLIAGVFLVIALVIAYFMEILDIYLYCVGAVFLIFAFGYLAFKDYALSLMYFGLTFLSWASFAKLRDLGIY